MVFSYTLETRREGIYDVTQDVRDAVEKSEVKDGICVIYCPHTTSGITINENADPDVKHDLLLGINEVFKDRDDFLHAEGNSHAHLKASYIGASETVIIRDGALLLGTWQGIYFCEFDGPRTRRFYVKVLEG